MMPIIRFKSSRGSRIRCRRLGRMARRSCVRVWMARLRLLTLGEGRWLLISCRRRCRDSMLLTVGRHMSHRGPIASSSKSFFMQFNREIYGDKDPRILGSPHRTIHSRCSLQQQRHAHLHWFSRGQTLRV